MTLGGDNFGYRSRQDQDGFFVFGFRTVYMERTDEEFLVLRESLGVDTFLLGQVEQQLQEKRMHLD